jgi:hypothetical protein
MMARGHEITVRQVDGGPLWGEWETFEISAGTVLERGERLLEGFTDRDSAMRALEAS